MVAARHRRGITGQSSAVGSHRQLVAVGLDDDAPVLVRAVDDAAKIGIRAGQGRAGQT